jgi:hypothetical protein
MSLILFSLQKEKEIVGIDSLTSKISVDSSYLFESKYKLI